MYDCKFGEWSVMSIQTNNRCYLVLLDQTIKDTRFMTNEKKTKYLADYHVLVILCILDKNT